MHFSGHAVHTPDVPLHSYLQAADGRLTAEDVYALPDVRMDLVTLAACETAVNAIEAGDEPLGLIPAFLYSGAAAVLATMWPVNASSAACLMNMFYTSFLSDGHLNKAGRLAGKARALQKAVVALIEGRQRGPSGEAYNTPYHWAPYVLFGDGT